MATGANSKVRILAVEDNPAILDFYREFFGELGFEIRTAEDALSAITLHQQFKPDLIVLDLNIPAGGGMHVFETLRMRLHDPVPVIISTGKPELLPHNLKSLHNVVFLPKPTPPERLLAEVRRMLPLRFSGAADQKPPPPPAPAANGVKPRILVVDDDHAILELFTEILSKAGFETRTAEDAIAAVTLFQDFKPRLVVLDVDMPAGGGRQVFSRLRLQIASPVPVLFCTATPAAVGDLEKNAGVMVLRKPVTPGVLLGAVNDLLKAA